VTGSTSGIGLGIARRLAAAGADVVLNGFGEAAAIEAVRGGLEKEFGVRAIFAPADIAKAGDAAGRVAAAERGGSGFRWEALDADLSVDGLVAGIFGSEIWMREMGRRGGIISSPAKTRAARQNGRKGGRPRKAERAR
jgi:NAD(P)-dependent dehydrogenase (short-subunit alcohol dehydrogenase family)